MLHTLGKVVRRLLLHVCEVSHADDTLETGDLAVAATARTNRLGEGMTHISVDSLSTDTILEGPSMGSSSSTNRVVKTIAGGDLHPRPEVSHPAMQQITGHPIMQSTSEDNDDATSHDSDGTLDMPSLAKDTEEFLSDHFRRIIDEGKAHLPAMIKKAVRFRSQSNKKAHKEALQRAKDDATAKQKELTESFQRQLQHKEEELQTLKQRLLNSEAQCSSLKSSLTSKCKHVAAVEAQKAMKVKECSILHDALDEKDFELDTLRSKGRELLTFQGLTTSEADVSSLKVALRDLSDQLQNFAEAAHSRKFASPYVPHIVDVQGMRVRQHFSNMCICATKHTALLILAAVVFGSLEENNSFYHSELAVLAGSRLSSSPDPECTVLQLQLEQKVANYWLQSLRPWAANNIIGNNIGSSSSADTAILDKYTGLFMSSLLSGEKMQWNQSHDPTEVLTPVAKRLIAAALKVQIIAAAMHSRLIRIYVPGWLPRWCRGQHLPGTSSAPVPDSWGAFPGVVPLSKELMQPGVRLLASPTPGLFSKDNPEVAAVFCQEPAVVQIAERVGDLPGSVNARQQHSGTRSPHKVLIRARMAVATK